MIKKEILNKILWSTIEDFASPWEIVWELNTIFPNNSEVKNTQIAQKILKYFFTEDLIQFYKGKWGSQNTKFELISIDDLDSLLREGEFWRPRILNEEYIALSSTENGEGIYNKDKLEDLN